MEPRHILRRTREAKRLSQTALTAAAGLPVRAVERLEAGTGSTGNLMRALAAVGLELHPVPANPRQHISTLDAGIVIRKAEPTWSTPAHITGAVLQAFKAQAFCLDAASPAPPCVPCKAYYTEATDGLAQPWAGKLVWCNPPYSRDLGRWLLKAGDEFEAGRAQRLVLLVPGRMETAGMRRLREAGAVQFVLHQRLRFGGQEHLAPWASVVATLGGSTAELARLGALLPGNDRLR